MGWWRRFQWWICRNGHGHWGNGLCSVCGATYPVDDWPEGR